MISTTDDARDIEKCHEIGCNIYVVKPLDSEQFLQAIQKVDFSYSSLPSRRSVSRDTTSRMGTTAGPKVRKCAEFDNIHHFRIFYGTLNSLWPRFGTSGFRNRSIPAPRTEWYWTLIANPGTFWRRPLHSRHWYPALKTRVIPVNRPPMSMRPGVQSVTNGNTGNGRTHITILPCNPLPIRLSLAISAESNSPIRA